MIRFILTLLCSSAVLCAAELPFLSPAPQLTGKPGHPGWKNAAKYAFPQKDTFALVGRDKTHLYIAVRSSHGSIDNRIHTLTAHDSPVYMNDCLDIFINTSGQKDFYQVIANVNGAVYDHHRKENGAADSAWDSGAKAAGSYGKDSFYIEVKIPIASLAPMKGGFSMMLNSYQRWRLKGTQILGKAHSPETFTRFDLKEDYPLLLTAAETIPFSGKRIFTYTLQNTDKRTLKLTPLCGKEKIPFTLPAGAVKTLKVPVWLPGEKENIVTLLLTEKDRELLRVCRYLKVKKTLDITLSSDILYDDDPLPLSVKVNEKQTEPVRIEYLPGKVKCSYKGESIEFSYRRIPSPWKN